jgi:hypothetical protein
MLIFFLNSEFRNRNSNFLIFQQRNLKKKNPTGIFGIENGIGILLSMRVPEIRTKNWNSQPSLCESISMPYSQPHYTKHKYLSRIHLLHRNKYTWIIPSIQPTKIEHHHGGAICRVKWHGYCELANILASTSLRWVGHGQR